MWPPLLRLRDVVLAAPWLGMRCMLSPPLGPGVCSTTAPSALCALAGPEESSLLRHHSLSTWTFSRSTARPETVAGLSKILLLVDAQQQQRIRHIQCATICLCLVTRKPLHLSGTCGLAQPGQHTGLSEAQLMSDSLRMQARPGWAAANSV